MKLITDTELAERFDITVEDLHALRARNHWPCVKLGRFKVRFTEMQVEQIVAQHTEAPAKPAHESNGLTARSARRSA